MGYYESPQWWFDLESAIERVKVTCNQAVGPVRYVEVEAGTGSRYAVAASRLPPRAEVVEGGPMLVSVLSPWKTCYVLDEFGVLYWTYVEEKFISRREVNAGDLVGVTVAIGAALGRPVELPVRSSEEKDVWRK